MSDGTPPPFEPDSSGSEPAPDPAPPEPVPPHPAGEGEPFWTYIDVAVFAGSALPCILLGVGIVKLFFWLLGWKTQDLALVAVPAQGIGYLLLFGVLYLMFRLYDRPFWRSLGWVVPQLSPLWVVSSGMGAAIVVVFVGNLIQTPNTENEITRMMKDPASLAMMVVFGVLVAPLCEELAFRGFLQPLLVRSFGVVPGVLGAAIPFGLLHYREYGNSWRHALLISRAGAAFGWMRQSTRSTLASSLMHAAYNALFFAAYFATRGAAR